MQLLAIFHSRVQHEIAWRFLGVVRLPQQVLQIQKSPAWEPQARVPVHPGDTPEALAARVLEQEHRLYPMVLRRFAMGDRTPIRL